MADSGGGGGGTRSQAVNHRVMKWKNKPEQTGLQKSPRLPALSSDGTSYREASQTGAGSSQSHTTAEPAQNQPRTSADAWAACHIQETFQRGERSTGVVMTMRFLLTVKPSCPRLLKDTLRGATQGQLLVNYPPLPQRCSAPWTHSCCLQQQPLFTDTETNNRQLPLFCSCFNTSPLFSTSRAAAQPLKTLLPQ